MKPSHLVLSLIAAASTTALNSQGAAPARAPHAHGPAGTQAPGVHARELNQSGRINQGVRSGQLTRSEAVKLRTDQKAIREEAQGYRADGVVTTEDRKDLQQDLNQSSKEIYQQKHDSEKRYPVPPPVPVPESRAQLKARRAQALQKAKPGQLTQTEAQGLRQEGKEVRAEIKDARSDGQVTQDERRKIHEDLRILRQRRFAETHDDEVRSQR